MVTVYLVMCKSMNTLGQMTCFVDFLNENTYSFPTEKKHGYWEQLRSVILVLLDFVLFMF